MRLATIAISMVLSATALAQEGPAGLWTTFNDGGQPDGVVRISERAAGYDAIVQAVFSPPAPSAQPLCELCSGELKDKPVVGMAIARGLKRDGDGWSGEILDPDDGRVYRCALRLLEGGRKLEVRGYVGIPLFGRTQLWQRRD